MQLAFHWGRLPRWMRAGGPAASDQQSVVRIDPAAFSECPGTSWCADEGGKCLCLGVVRYAAAKYATTEDVLGDQIVVLDRIHGRNVQKHECATRANADYGPTDGRRLAGKQGLQTSEVRAPGQLKTKTTTNTNNNANNNTNKNNNWTEEVAKAVIQQPDSALLELRGKDESGNACFQLYLPWALVEIDGELRCAYEFGAQAASLRDASPDGPNGIIDERKLRSRSGTLQCFARTEGEAAEGICAVALQPLQDLIRGVDARIEVYWLLIIGCGLAFLFCWMPSCWFLFFKEDDAPQQAYQPLGS
ncbi:unnamed protein product [Polarella glacialis]|uniref:Uncharacterized protein n=1 Tax=Polarella glacialis TaxID=89957 RepID=A0A813L1Y6_POLGL|nr:unnamed protein product [Polarella glacialis]